ncbi:hypothetical protein [Streptomyces sp. BPTC-684]|uniref:hypothetical protein n=1 Tax=Streptomyces sp. BPTC-684 TaxID=3043734 RepID=UPI0024B2596A|nr:hypothetical protein [Streptomyces sp. BPTC-684]WHM40575.1 hypothetical protein QIY60_29375 [Streptomyces sp. BPTC-684]
MDQQTDDQHTALNAAALNPAHVPGLMPAPAAAPEASTEGQKTDRRKAAEPGPEAEAEDVTAGEPEPAAAPTADADAEPGADDPDPERPAPGAAEDGPALSVSDRRGSITADHSGIRLRLDDEEADFGWDELSAVEYATSRWNRRFTVTVHLPRPRWFRMDVQAEDRASLAQWSEQLEDVLNAYFEE